MLVHLAKTKENNHVAKVKYKMLYLKNYKQQ